jgi:flagellar biosynthesis anti-sigma factor FlgM
MPIDGIDGKYPPGILQFPPGNGNGNGKGNGVTRVDASSQPQDEKVSSGKNLDFLEIRKMVDAQPDVRLDKVNRLAKAIDDGTYDVSGQKIADAIIRKHLVDYNA